MPDNTYGEQLGLSMIPQALGGIMGLALGDINDKRQLRQQEKLQALQIAGQKDMTNYNYGKQLEMWKATSYPAQMEQLKLAGLNPGLLYGMSGGGGQSTGSGSGASVTGGQAPTGGREVQDMMGMGIQYRLLEAQKANIEADTKNKEAQTPNIEASTSSLLQGIENAKAQKEFTEIQTSILEIEAHIKGRTQNAAIAIILQELRESYERMGIMINENLISDATRDEKIKIIEVELIAAGLKNELTKSQTEKADAEIKNMATQIQISLDSLKNEQDRTVIQKKLQEFETGFGKQAAGVLQTLIDMTPLGRFKQKRK